jgi:acyl-CoA synthetase (NDP forming)
VRGDLSRLLRPRSVAVLGGKPAAEVVRQLRRIGYDGEIWPVHPRLDEVAGLRAYRSIAALPAAPDAAFLGVNRHATIDSVAALAARGAGGVVVYAAGFAESGPGGEDLQARLIEAAGAMPFIGPNCYGFINYLDGTLLWPDQHGDGARPQEAREIAPHGSASERPQEVARDDVALDLAGAVPDALDPRVAP